MTWNLLQFIPYYLSCQDVDNFDSDDYHYFVQNLYSIVLFTINRLPK